MIPSERTCTPKEEKDSQSCKNVSTSLSLSVSLSFYHFQSVTVLAATFESIQGQHEAFSAGDHIGISRNCDAALVSDKEIR